MAVSTVSNTELSAVGNTTAIAASDTPTIALSDTSTIAQSDTATIALSDTPTIALSDTLTIALRGTPTIALSDAPTIALSDTPESDDAVSETTVIPARDTVSTNTFVDTAITDVGDIPVAVRGTPVNSNAFSFTQRIANSISDISTLVPTALISDTTGAIAYDRDVLKPPNIFTTSPNTFGAVKDTDAVTKTSGSQHFLPPEDDTTAATNISITKNISGGVNKPASYAKDSEDTPTEFCDMGSVYGQNGIINHVNHYGVNLKKEQDIELDNRAPTHDDFEITTTLPKFQKYANSSERNKSFKSAPKNLHENCSSLCKAGFFYAGPLVSAPGVTESDKRHWVVCFYCGLGLRDLSTDVWSQHRALAPKCPYVLLHEGTADVEDTSCHGPKEEKQDTKTGPSSYYKALEEDVAVKLLVQEGYDLLKVLEVADQLKKEGTTFSSVDILWRLDPEKASSQLSEESRKLKEEIVLMKKTHICQTCQENPVQVVYLPCGDFLSCVECAIIEGLMKNACKVCSKPVRGLVRGTLT